MKNLSDFYQFRARAEWNWANNNTVNLIPILNSYDINPDDPIPGVMNWYNDKRKCDVTFPQIIPVKDWDWDGLIGTSENQLLHHHYNDIVNYHLTYPEPQHKILILFECSNAKPYNKVHHLKWYMRTLQNHCDFGLADYGIIPMSYTEMYPYNADEWDHYKEGEYMYPLYNWVSEENFNMVMDKWKYEKVLVVMQNPHPRHWLEELAKKDDRIVMVTDKKFDEMMKKKYYPVFHSTGIICTRTMILYDTRLALLNKLIPIVRKIEGKEPKDLKELRTLVLNHHDSKGINSIAYKTQQLSWYSKKADVEYPSAFTTDRVIHPIPESIHTDPKVFTNIIKEEESPVIACLGYLKELVDSGRHTIINNIYEDYWALRKAMNRSRKYKLLPLSNEYEQGYIFYNPNKVTEEEAFRIASRNSYLKPCYVEVPYRIREVAVTQWNRRHPEQRKVWKGGRTPEDAA